MDALVRLAMWEERREHMKPEASEKIVAIVKKELNFDPNDAEALKAFPLHVFFAATMGHHPDVFHPQVGMQSYYLKGEHVGGSADCMLVNRKMLKPEEQALFTHAAMGKKLADRLNAPKPAEWEANPAVLYGFC